MLSQEPNAQKTSNIPKIFMLFMTHCRFMVHMTSFSSYAIHSRFLTTHVISWGSHKYKLISYQGFTRHNVKCTLLYLRHQLCKLIIASIADSRSRLVSLDYEVALDIMSSVTYVNTWTHSAPTHLQWSLHSMTCQVEHSHWLYSTPCRVTPPWYPFTSIA